MERLTQRTTEGILVKEDYGDKVLKTLYSCHGDKPLPHFANCEEGYCAMDKLAKYEDEEEDGLLLRLPCKEGTTVYRVGYRVPCQFEHHGYLVDDDEACEYCPEGCCSKREYYISKTPATLSMIASMIENEKNPSPDFLVFFTEEEAQKVLAEKNK